MCVCVLTLFFSDELHLSDASIGDTVLSKSWGLSVLVRAVNSISAKKEKKKMRKKEEEEQEREGEKEKEGEGEGEGEEREGEEKKISDNISDKPVMCATGENCDDGDSGDGEEGSVEEEGERTSDGVKGERKEGEGREGGEGERDSDDSLDENLEEDLCRLWDASMNRVKNYKKHTALPAVDDTCNTCALSLSLSLSLSLCVCVCVCVICHSRYYTGCNDVPPSTECC